jgi:hypothetical protein
MSALHLFHLTGLQTSTQYWITVADQDVFVRQLTSSDQAVLSTTLLATNEGLKGVIIRQTRGRASYKSAPEQEHLVDKAETGGLGGMQVW